MHRMFVCLCKAVTENHIREAVADGVRDFDDLRARLDLANECGTCENTALDVFEACTISTDMFYAVGDFANRNENASLSHSS